MNSDSEGTAATELPAGRTPAAPLSGRLKAILGAVGLVLLVMIVWPRGQGTEPGGFLYDGTGRPSPMAQRMSPVTLVHFWATWCPPCIQEVPAIQRLSADFAGRQDFTVLMIAVADRRDKVDRFLGSAAAMALYDPNWDVAHRYGSTQIPETYLVVRGKVVEKFVGATNWDDPLVRRRLQSYLEVSKDKMPAGS